MHAKTDSEVTSLAPSSPTRSPRRPAYYVQSPSRDSHDGEKTTTSLHSTPVLSPMASPRHSHSSVGHHSRDSSSSRFSGALKPGGSGKIVSNDGGKGGRRKSEKTWKEFTVIEEEGLLEDEEEGKRFRRQLYFLGFLLSFIVIFSFFALILWAASRSQGPKITMKSITFESFIIQAGTDASMVPTDMATLNSTVKLSFRNTGTFFGVHVTSTPFDLTYNQLTLASGNMNKFYQSRKSHRTLSVVVLGSKIPLYGGGPSLMYSPGKTNNSVPVHLSLNFMVRSRAYVLGRLVKPKFYTGVHCSVVMDQTKLNTLVSLKKSCQYS
ncbi:uncharacterized protein LOC120112466 [Phoenix dactylifera]|uniref:Uncharacterized protein LOC120112466 n=1 Tax=Phoenix dactylifera TaxID=42345 RepID=A0A8B9AWW9_PHODC|nr:uncharacterized protein LOC120112466 [Phoenix dactylifera]